MPPALTVIPAIDIRAGKVVRLKQGRLEEEKVYGGDPCEVARKWEAEGGARLHVVDLDAALSSSPQFDVVAKIIDAVGIPIEIGGGLRSLENAWRYRDRGADRLIFGTAAVAEPDMVREAARLWPGAVAVALDARAGLVAISGWKEITTLRAVDLAAQMKEWGVGRIQYTDVVRDGTLVGLNIAGIEELARESGVRLTAAGGVSTLEDLQRLRTLTGLSVDEVVVGKALYERRFTLAEAIAAAQGDD